MRRVAVAIALACVLGPPAADAQPVRVRVRARLGRFGELRLTTCTGDPPPEEWRRRVQEEFGDPTFTLYEPSQETAAIHAELRVVLRAARCAEGAEAYELFMTDGRGEAAQTVMLALGGVARDDRPQVAALRVAEVFRTHRTELLSREPPTPVVEIPRSRREIVAASAAWDVEAAVALRALPSTGLWVGGPQVALGYRSTPASRQRLRFELGTTAVLASTNGFGPTAGVYRTWLACGWTVAALRSRRAELSLGGRAEVALNWVYPTVTLGGTIEGQVAVSARLGLWVRADLGWHVLGAQVRVYDLFSVPSQSSLHNVAEGFTAAFTAGARYAL